MGRRLLIVLLVAVIAACQVWIVTGGQLRGGLEGEESAPDMKQFDELERLLMTELSEEHRRELTDDQMEQMTGMSSDEERKLFLLDCFGDQPSKAPSSAPSYSPTVSMMPSVSTSPSLTPSETPSSMPSVSAAPSNIPTVSLVPSTAPSSGPPSSSPTTNCLFDKIKNTSVGRVRNFFGRADIP